MDDARVRTLLDQASERYNEGAYEEAIALWQQAQEIDPANQKAREGIRMASLLVSTEAGATQQVPAGQVGPDPLEQDPRVGAALARVRELLGAGQHDEAREGIALLRELAPHLDGLDLLEAEASAGAAETGVGGDTMAIPAMDAEALLEQARSALAEGREDDAARAAAQALELEPGNMEACGILSLTGHDGAVGHPPAGDVAEEAPPAHDTAPQRAIAASPPQAAPRASAPASGDSSPKVVAMLAEGQVAFDQGRMQDAIATWSRIFAVDPSHAEAGRRIDQAKAAIEEHAREVDDLFYRAMDAQQSGQFHEALGLYEQVLQIHPNHADAQAASAEMRERMEGGGPSIAIDPAAREAAKASRPPDEETMFSPVESVPLARPAPEHRPAPRRELHVPARAHESGGRGKFLAVSGGIVVFAAAGIGAWLWLGTGGSMSEAQATAVPPARPVTRPAAAQKPPENPSPLQVVPGTAPAPAPAPAQEPPAGSTEPSGDPREALARARQADKEGRWADAALAYREALRMNPADFDSQDRLDRAIAELEKQARYEREMEQAVGLFGEGDFGGCLHKLYRLQQDYPAQRQLEDYIRNAWYNWGVALLQAGDVDEAVEKFSEVLALAPRDSVSSRAREVARRYHGRPRDSVLESFAAGMPVRALDAP